MIALFSAVLLILIHPSPGFTFLAPLALIPLFLSVLWNRPRFLTGWLTGIVYWAGTCYWIQSTLQQHGGMSSGLSYLLFILFCLVKAIQMGIFTFAAPLLCRRWWSAPALAALWTFLEWTHNYTGFAWLVLGNAAQGWPTFTNLAPVAGVWGISFAFALISAIAATRHWQWLSLFLLLIFVPRLPQQNPAPYTAWAVQPNLPEDAVYSAQSTAALQQHLAVLSQSRVHPTLIVWPEVPAPLYDSDRFLPLVPRASNAPLLAGIVSHDSHGTPLNSALLLSPEGRFVSRYDKVNLVPFGEFVPWPFDAIAHKVSTEAGDFAPGTQPVVANSIGTFICYESVFPNYIRQFPLRGARTLFNLSNDSWFGHSAARDQHFLIARMRAVENHRWIVRVTNNGITAAIDPAGQIHDVQRSFEEVAAALHYGEDTVLTPYTRYGDWFIAVCLAICFFATVISASARLSSHGPGRTAPPPPANTA